MCVNVCASRRLFTEFAFTASIASANRIEEMEEGQNDDYDVLGTQESQEVDSKCGIVRDQVKRAM